MRSREVSAFFVVGVDVLGDPFRREIRLFLRTVEDACPYQLCCANKPPRREVFVFFASLLQREKGDHDSGG